MSAKILLRSMIAVSLVLQVVPAPAQDRPSAEDGASAREEIIVTARRREESILNVPVVMSVVTKESLEKFETDNLYAVVAYAPGLHIGDNVAANGTQISLRGVGTAAVNPTIDQSVALNLDGLSLNHGLAYSAGMFDVAQVEVLKGPQALFYGKNSPGGVVALRSADPTDTTEATVRIGYESEAEEKMGEAILSGPVAPWLKLRLAARYSDLDGFLRNDSEVIPDTGALNPAFRNLAPRQDWMVRGTALFDAGEAYEARLKINYTDWNMDGNGGALQLANCPDGTGGVPPINIAFIGGDDCKLNESLRMAWLDPVWFPGIRNAGVPYLSAQQGYGTLEQNLHLPHGLILTSVTGYYKLEMDSLINGTGTGASVAFGLETDYYNRQATQELRLTSNFGSPVNFVLGAFYQDAFLTNSPRLPGNTRLGLPVTLQSTKHTIDIGSLSVFGQLLWKVTPTIELAGGGRWTDEDREHAEINFNPAQGPVGPVPLLDPKLTADNFSPEFSLTYTPTQDFTVFASYREGFKSGSFNTNAFISPTTVASFTDEKAKGGDIGIKARPLDGRMSLNVAAYYYHYEDLQVGANEVTPQGAIVNRTLNAASANVYGLDADVAYATSQVVGLTLNAAVNWNHARYDKFTNAPCGNGQTIGQGCDQILNPATGRFTSQDLSGEPLVRAPDWSASFGFDYQRSFGNDMTLGFASNTFYSSEYYTNVVTRPAWIQDGYIKTSASLSLSGRDGGWEVALIGNNLTNEIMSGNCYNSNAQEGSVFGGKISGAPLPGPAGDDETNCLTEPGRSWWLRLTLRPKEFFN